MRGQLARQHRAATGLAVLFFVCTAQGATAAAPFEDNLAQRLQACTTCHGPQGRAGPDAYYPRLAGKPAHYLYKQLLDFRDGRRHYPLMAGLLEPLSDDYLLDIARYFSALALPYAAPAPAAALTAATAAQLARGRVLAQEGDPSRKLPACAACHGAALTGVAPDVPGLLGLSRSYLNAQLGGWRAGQRQGSAPDCMAVVAKRLDPADVVAVSAWLSAQTLPGLARAASDMPAEVKNKLARDHGDLSCARVTLPARSVPVAAVLTPVAQGPSVRGAYLARAGNCAGCHTATGGAPYAGGRAIDTPFGKVFAGNLTPDATHGLGSWSRDDFWQALHHGRSKSGRLLYPAFPYTNYTRVSRADADALFAFLQSLPPQAVAPTPHLLRWPYSSQVALWAWRALYFTPGEFEPSTEKSADWNRGAYLVQGLGHCSACHASRNALGASATGLAGGLIPMQNWYAPALTLAQEAGVAHWDTADIVALLKEGSAKGATVSGPMAQVVLGSTQHLREADLAAMATYLKALPDSGTPPAPAVALSSGAPARAAKLYEKHCAQCHGAQGQGVQTPAQAGLAGRWAYPALAGNRAVTLANPVNLVQIVLQGAFAPATAANPQPFGMPPFMLELQDGDVAAVLSHIRTSWGNRAGTVTELDVAQVRQLTAR